MTTLEADIVLGIRAHMIGGRIPTSIKLPRDVVEALRKERDAGPDDRLYVEVPAKKGVTLVQVVSV